MNKNPRPEIIYYAAVSLDGYIADPGGGVEFLDRYMELGEDYGFVEFEASIDGLIMGSSTYEKSIELAPWSGGDKPCWVFSLRNLQPVASSVIITSNTPEQVSDEMYERGIRRAWFMGGGKLASSFRRFDLLTE
ncbi:MAG: dihydrofolate reductase family protein [Pirellulaceae bacterium]